jgi:hypothetical protein
MLSYELLFFLRVAWMRQSASLGGCATWRREWRVSECRWGRITHTQKKTIKKKKWTTAKGAQLSNQCCLPAKSTKKGREGRFVLLLCESLTQVGFERNIREGERFSTKNTTHEKKKLCLSNRRSSNGWGVVKKGNTTGWASIKNIRLFFFLAQS